MSARGCATTWTRSTWPSTSPRRGCTPTSPGCGAAGWGRRFWSVYAPPSTPTLSTLTATLEQIDAVRCMAARYPDDLVLAYSADDMEAARRTGPGVASLLGMEGEALHRQLAGSTAIAVRPWRAVPDPDPLQERRVGGQRHGRAWRGRAVGVRARGRRECNRLGMIADLSHVADSTMHATLDISSRGRSSRTRRRAGCAGIRATCPTTAGPGARHHRRRDGELRAGVPQRGVPGLDRRLDR